MVKWWENDGKMMGTWENQRNIMRNSWENSIKFPRPWTRKIIKVNRCFPANHVWLSQGILRSLCYIHYLKVLDLNESTILRHTQIFILPVAADCICDWNHTKIPVHNPSLFRMIVGLIPVRQYRPVVKWWTHKSLWKCSHVFRGKSSNQMGIHGYSFCFANCYWRVSNHPCVCDNLTHLPDCFGCGTNQLMPDSIPLCWVKTVKNWSDWLNCSKS